jgi:hypothetical protein
LRALKKHVSDEGSIPLIYSRRQLLAKALIPASRHNIQVRVKKMIVASPALSQLGANGRLSFQIGLFHMDTKGSVAQLLAL